jgi:hypothetical protein
MSNKIITSVDLEGKEVKVLVKKPTPKNYRDSQMAYNSAMRVALDNGAMFKDKLRSYYVEQKIWDENKEKEYQRILKSIQSLEKQLKEGGIALKQARGLALSLKKARGEFSALIAERQSFEANSAESQAENARFNFLIAACVCDPNGTPKWKNVEAYDEDAQQPWANEAAQELANMLYGLEPDYEKRLTENQFLIKYKFADKDLSLINADGHKVDLEGRLINDEGRFVAYRESGEQYFVDIDGNEVTETGEPIIHFSPFLDDDGNPIVEESAEQPEEKVEEVSVQSDAVEPEKPVEVEAPTPVE